jgi:polyvinyl alcohol dehydrogenase (cytochrome)
MKIVILLLFFTFALCASVNSQKLLSHGYNQENTRNADDTALVSRLSSANVDEISMVWSYNTTGWVTATPAVYRENVYFPDSAGYVYAVNRRTSLLVWSIFIPDYTGIEGDYSRTTPAIGESRVVIGLQNYGRVLTVHLADGGFLWSTRINFHPLAIVTMSATIHGDGIYVGAASKEELAAANPSYPCCSLRGNFVRLHLGTGDIVWDTPLIDMSIDVGPGTYSGVATWGSSPPIDLKRNVVYISTGNPYNVSQEAAECILADPTSDDCIDPLVYYNGVLALDLDTGIIKWYKRLSAYDAWVVPCIFEGPNCPPVPGPDADFGMAPILKRNVRMSGGIRDVLLIGQKSGVAWNLDAEDGNVNWGVKVGPGGTLGGISWGAAADNHRLIVGLINSNNECWEVTSPTTYPCVRGGGWTALNIAGGSTAWQTPAPKTLTPPGEDTDAYILGSKAAGPGGMVNDLFIAGSTVKDGTVVIMKKWTGQILKEYDTGASIYGGPAISDDCFFIGHGYNPLFNEFWTTGHRLFAFCLPDEYQ